ncbi:MAG: M50 family metallopeptidase, partial [Pseudonocardiaceae bacterium]
MDLWTLITTPVPHLHPAWVGACAVVALVLVFTPANLIVTLFHETGHALTSLVFAGGFSGINLHSSGSGLTGVYVTSR